MRETRRGKTVLLLAACLTAGAVPATRPEVVLGGKDGLPAATTAARAGTSRLIRLLDSLDPDKRTPPAKRRPEWEGELLTLTAQLASNGREHGDREAWAALENWQERCSARLDEAGKSLGPWNTDLRQDLSLWCRLQLLIAAAYIRDGGPENLQQAQRRLQQVQQRTKQYTGGLGWSRPEAQLHDRAAALEAVCRCLRYGMPSKPKELRRLQGLKGPPGKLVDAVATLYVGTSKTDPMKALRNVRRKLVTLAPPQGRPDRLDAEVIVAKALGEALGAVSSICNRPVLSRAELQEARPKAELYRMPGPLRSTLGRALRQHDSRLEFDQAFRDWSKAPYTQGKLDKLPRPTGPPDAFEYYRCIYGSWQADCYHRSAREGWTIEYLRRGLKDYSDRLGALKRLKDKGRNLFPPGCGHSRVEKYVTALLELYVKPGRPDALQKLRDPKAGWSLANPVDRAMEYHLLRYDLHHSRQQDSSFWEALKKQADALYQATVKARTPDAACAATYQKLAAELDKKLTQCRQRQRKDLLAKAEKLMSADNLPEALRVVAGALRIGARPSGKLLETLLDRAVRRDELVADEKFRQVLYELCERLSSAGPEQGLLAETYRAELAVREQRHRLSAPGPAGRQAAQLAARAARLILGLSAPPADAGSAADRAVRRYRRIRQVAHDTTSTNRWNVQLRRLAQLLWLEALIDADHEKAYEAAFRLITSQGPPPFDFQELLAQWPEAKSGLRRRLLRLIEHFASKAAPQARSMLAMWLGRRAAPFDEPGDQETLKKLLSTYEREVLILQAARVAGAPEGKAFAALAEVGGLPERRPGRDGEILRAWRNALERLQQEARSPEQLELLARQNLHQHLAWRKLAERARASAERFLRMLSAPGAAGSRADRAKALARQAGRYIDAARFLLGRGGHRNFEDDPRWFFESYLRLSASPGLDRDARKRWKLQAARSLRGGDEWTCYRRAVLYYEIGQFKTDGTGEVNGFAECLKVIKRIPRPWPADLKILAAMCRFHLAWRPTLADLGPLAQQIGQWCDGQDPGGRYRFLEESAAGLRAGSAARRDILLALLYLHDQRRGRDARALERCAASLGSAAGKPPRQSGPFDGLLHDEPALAGIFHDLLRLRLAGLETRPQVRRERLAELVRSALPDPARAAGARRECLRRFCKLPAALREELAPAAYEGRCWARAEVAYWCRLDRPARARALSAEDIELIRRWMECEVRRRGQAEATLAARVRQAAEKLRRYRLKVGRQDVEVDLLRRFAAGKDPRRLAALMLWARRPEPARRDLPALYCRMVRDVARSKLTGAGPSFEEWSFLRADGRLRPHASLWCFASLWPLLGGVQRDWAYRGPAWPYPLQQWLRKVKRGNLGTAAEFDNRLQHWVRAAVQAGISSREVRAEAYLMRYLLGICDQRASGRSVRDERAFLLKAVRTFAIGNPEYSLAVELLEGGGAVVPPRRRGG